MHKPKFAILSLVHASVQKLPLEEEQLGLSAGLTPVVSRGFAGAAEGERRFATGVEGKHTCQHLYSTS